jgi:hypothetical protein
LHWNTLLVPQAPGLLQQLYMSLKERIKVLRLAPCAEDLLWVHLLLLSEYSSCFKAADIYHNKKPPGNPGGFFNGLFKKP